MKFRIAYKVLNILADMEDNEGETLYPEIKQHRGHWRKNNTDYIELDSKVLSSESFELIKNFILNDTEETNETILKIYSVYKNKLKTYEKLLSLGATATLKSLNEVEVSFYSYCKELPNHRFYIDADGILLPYRAIKSTFISQTQDYPAHVTMSFSYYARRSKYTKSFSVFLQDIKGSTIAEILESNGFLIESEEMNDEYEKQIIFFNNVISNIGKVYVATGSGSTKSSRSWHSSKTYFKENELNTVVSDYNGYDIENDNSINSVITRLEKSAISGDAQEVPEHPITTIFHLDDHKWIDIHVNNLKPYEFKGKALLEQLVLPDEHLTLINILMEMSKIDIEDIIEGKKGGSFIMSTGEPGTGKTLSAEVFAEAMALALYKVQCSQLGMDVTSIEKNLKLVLNRASRWGAILLVDEADVYVRARGADIMQNAIVGVFLRTLEYYTGILFMTSNLSTSIDDAIMSRATAHLVYEIPTPENLAKIWHILNDKFDTKLSSEIIDQLVMSIPGIVGRDVKSLLKLAKMYSTQQDKPCTFESIKLISKFVPNVAKLV